MGYRDHHVDEQTVQLKIRALYRVQRQDGRDPPWMLLTLKTTEAGGIASPRPSDSLIKAPAMIARRLSASKLIKPRFFHLARHIKTVAYGYDRGVAHRRAPDIRNDLSIPD